MVTHATGCLSTQQHLPPSRSAAANPRRTRSSSALKLEQLRRQGGVGCVGSAAILIEASVRKVTGREGFALVNVLPVMADEVAPDKWLADSGATNHTAGNASVKHDTLEPAPGSERVQIGL